MKFGLHLSISGGLHRSILTAVELGCDTFQIFGANPRAWAYKELSIDEITTFNNELNKTNIKEFVLHLPYLPNFATPDILSFKKSVKVLKLNLDYTRQINAKYLVLHPGKGLGQKLDKSIELVSSAINIGLSNSPGNSILLIENTAGQGTEIGWTFEQIGNIIKNIKNKKRIGICIDTAHAFAAGYDFNDELNFKAMMREIDNYIGFEKIHLIHLNDSKSNCGSAVDRHEHLGAGNIGFAGLKRFLKYEKFRNLLCILETPKDSDDADKINLKNARELFL